MIASRSNAMTLLVALFVAISLAAYIPAFPARLLDFRAFYCAGRMVLARTDPYRVHPLHECEHALASPGLADLDAEITVPAPFPGMVLALFAVLATMPFAWAALLWTLTACVALGAAVVVTARVTATPLGAAAIVLAFPAAIVPLALGQLTPFVLLAICGCAALLHARRPELAALAALGTALDPHVGLAVGLGLFVGVPRARTVLIAGAVALSALGLAVSGAAQEWEYARWVLPAHALLNVPEFTQFSAANLAFLAGVPAGAAVTMGNVWYAVALVTGVVVALRLRARLGIVAIALVPPAFVVFGGAYSHLQHLALAIPAFLLVSSAASGKRRAAFVSLTFIAAMPWLLIVPFPILFASVAVLAVAFARTMSVPRIAFALSAGACIGLVALCVALVRTHAAPGSLVLAVPTGNPLAEVPWGAFVHAMPPQAWAVWAKAPTELAFIGILALLVRAAARTRSGVRVATS